MGHIVIAGIASSCTSPWAAHACYSAAWVRRFALCLHLFYTPFGIRSAQCTAYTAPLPPDLFCYHVCLSFLQLFATSSLLRAMGMTAALGLAPAICLSALLGIAACPLPWMVAVSEVVRKVFGYAVLRPTREVGLSVHFAL